jgi:hypothetical protein
MSYFIENWIRGEQAEIIRKMAGIGDDFHPHITLVRPFSLKTGEEEVKQKLVWIG